MHSMGCSSELVKYIIATCDNTDELKRQQSKKNTSESVQENRGGYKLLNELKCIANKQM